MESDDMFDITGTPETCSVCGNSRLYVNTQNYTVNLQQFSIGDICPGHGPQ